MYIFDKIKLTTQMHIYISLILLINIIVVMLTQLGSKCNFLPSIPNNDQKSPYLLQYKVFQERMRRQQKGKTLSHARKNKTVKSHLHEDYMELTKNIISKKQNLNLFEDMPLETEPSMSHPSLSEQLACKTRMLFENKLSSKKQQSKMYRDEALSECKQNSNSQKSRIKSESNTNAMKQEKQRNSGISFIGYKRNKKPIVEMGFKKVLGFI